MINIPEDKKAHLNLGLLIGLALGAVPQIAIIAILTIGIGKEVYDYLYNRITGTQKHGVELLDALYTIGGGVLGMLTIHGISLLKNYL